MLITPERMIITLIPSGHIHPDMTDTERDTFPVKGVKTARIYPYPEFILAGIPGVSRRWIHEQECR